MSETPKRRRGDRRDAALLRETDALHFIMGIIYPHRADNEAYIAERIDLEPIKAYLAKKNVEGIEQCYLTEKDVVRHELVQRIVKAYAEYESRKPKDKPDGGPKHRYVRRKEEK